MSHASLRLLDGGMGRELQRSGAPFRQPEWSALALIEAPYANAFPPVSSEAKANSTLLEIRGDLGPEHIAQLHSSLLPEKEKGGA